MVEEPTEELDFSGQLGAPDARSIRILNMTLLQGIKNVPGGKRLRRVGCQKAGDRGVRQSDLSHTILKDVHFFLSTSS
jgi:hypothetical protein